jgi:hypothetical protein
MYNPHFFQSIFSFEQNSYKLASGKQAIPLLYGMIYRQLPVTEKAASAKSKIRYRTWSAKV